MIRIMIVTHTFLGSLSLNILLPIRVALLAFSRVSKGYLDSVSLLLADPRGNPAMPPKAQEGWSSCLLTSPPPPKAPKTLLFLYFLSELGSIPKNSGLNS